MAASRRLRVREVGGQLAAPAPIRHVTGRRQRGGGRAPRQGSRARAGRRPVRRAVRPGRRRRSPLRLDSGLPAQQRAARRHHPGRSGAVPVRRAGLPHRVLRREGSPGEPLDPATGHPRRDPPRRPRRVPASHQCPRHRRLHRRPQAVHRLAARRQPQPRPQRRCLLLREVHRGQLRARAARPVPPGTGARREAAAARRAGPERDGRHRPTTHRAGVGRPGVTRRGDDRSARAPRRGHAPGRRGAALPRGHRQRDQPGVRHHVRRGRDRDPLGPRHRRRLHAARRGPVRSVASRPTGSSRRAWEITGGRPEHIHVVHRGAPVADDLAAAITRHGEGLLSFGV